MCQLNVAFQRKAKAGRNHTHKKGKKKRKRRVGLGWEQKRCISIDLGSAQDISEIRTGSSSRVSDVPSRDAWSECNVIPGGSPALFPKLLTLCFLQKPADG